MVRGVNSGRGSKGLLVFTMASLGRAKAVFPYVPEAEDELSMVEGDIITVLDKYDDGWWKGELRGRQGVFPENYVEMIADAPVTTSAGPPGDGDWVVAVR